LLDGAPHVTPHGRQTTVPRVAHDLFVGHAVAVGSRHKAHTHAVPADWFCKRAFDAGLIGPVTS
jgi:hypothetical protein